MPAWLRFYRNSLDRLEDGVAAFAPVHEHSASLLVSSRVVDLGSCFGFFPADCRRRNGRGSNGSERTDHESCWPA